MFILWILISSSNAASPQDDQKPGKRYPGILTNFDFRTVTPEYIQDQNQKLMKVLKTEHDNVGRVEKENINFDNTIKPLIDLDGDSSNKYGIYFAKSVAIDKSLREAAAQAQKQLYELKTDLSLREDVYQNIKLFSESEEAKDMSFEQKRYVEKALRNGKRGGLLLNEKNLEEVRIIKKRISELVQKFNKCLQDDDSHFFVTDQKLSGVATDVIEMMEKGKDGKRKVTMNHISQVLKYCTNPETRYTMLKTYQDRCGEKNTATLEELINLRHRHANILGYPTHAAFVLEGRMAKTPENVDNFLTNLTSRFEVLWNKEHHMLIDLKESETKKLEIEINGTLAVEDIRHYLTLAEKKLYSVDHRKLKEYFPLDKVIAGTLDIYQCLLGLEFTKLEDGEVWHNDVLMYQVDDKETQETLGYFFLDLHPREGKFGHPRVSPLQKGSLDSHGKRQKAVAAMICDFPGEIDDKPALLEHGQVRIFFHEFGHVMDFICSRANISSFFGFAQERDFGEAPSQMLENWVWDKDALKMISGHYKDGSPIPKNLLDSLIASRLANVGYESLRLMYGATYDMILHTHNHTDTMKLSRELYRDFFGIERIEGTNYGATFSHLMGYDAGYYSYMWSRVLSQDMFSTRFAKEGIFNTTTGMDYRNKILRPGSSKDASDMIFNFLGRQPNQEAFLKSLGLTL